jgi:hypothetical protein
LPAATKRRGADKQRLAATASDTFKAAISRHSALEQFELLGPRANLELCWLPGMTTHRRGSRLHIPPRKRSMSGTVPKVE